MATIEELIEVPLPLPPKPVTTDESGRIVIYTGLTTPREDSPTTYDGV